MVIEIGFVWWTVQTDVTPEPKEAEMGCQVCVENRVLFNFGEGSCRWRKEGPCLWRELWSALQNSLWEKVTGTRVRG